MDFKLFFSDQISFMHRPRLGAGGGRLLALHEELPRAARAFETALRQEAAGTHQQGGCGLFWWRFCVFVCFYESNVVCQFVYFDIFCGFQKGYLSIQHIFMLIFHRPSTHWLSVAAGSSATTEAATQRTASAESRPTTCPLYAT